MITWLKLIDYLKWLVEAVGLPAVFIAAIVVSHGYLTQQMVEAHNTQTQEILTRMHEEQIANNVRVINYLRAICFNTAVYSKELMRECGKI